MYFHMLCGLPGSGKSTLTKQLSGYTVSTDQMRKFLWGNEAVVKHDRLVFDLVFRLTEYILANDLDLIFDATNLKTRSRKPLIQLAKKYDATIVVHWVTTSLETALIRNEKRERVVPPEIIKTMFDKIEPPKLKEGIDIIQIYNENLQLKKEIHRSKTVTHYP